MLHHRKIAISIIACFAAALLLAGCAGLAKITPFTANAAQAVAYSQCAEDYVAILDELEYNRFQNATTNTEIMEISKERAQRVAARRQVADAMIGVQNKLAEYISSLGKLSADDQTNAIEAGITKIINNMNDAKDEKGQKIFKADDVNAFGGLAKVLAREIMADYREEQLRSALEQSHDHVNNLLNMLIRITEYDMISQYELAKDATRSQYYTRSDSKVDQQTIIRCEEKLAAIDVKARRAQGYANLLRKVQHAHNFLYQHRNELASPQVLSTMQMHSAQIEALYNSLRQIR